MLSAAEDQLAVVVQVAVTRVPAATCGPKSPSAERLAKTIIRPLLGNVPVLVWMDAAPAHVPSPCGRYIMSWLTTARAVLGSTNRNAYVLYASPSVAGLERNPTTTAMVYAPDPADVMRVAGPTAPEVMSIMLVTGVVQRVDKLGSMKSLLSALCYVASYESSGKVVTNSGRRLRRRTSRGRIEVASPMVCHYRQKRPD